MLADPPSHSASAVSCSPPLSPLGSCIPVASVLTNSVLPSRSLPIAPSLPHIRSTAFARPSPRARPPPLPLLHRAPATPLQSLQVQSGILESSPDHPSSPKTLCSHPPTTEQDPP